jgi:phage terminase large subunit-like protein
VTEKSVTNADQINKTKQQFQLSHSLGERGGKHRVIGTRYHFADLYAETLEAGTYHARVYPITIDGTPTGEPVLLTRAQVAQQRLDDGPYVFACQKLLSPVADELQEFKQEWVRYYQQLPAEINLYILADPASSKKTDSDYTVIAVVGIDLLSNYYLVYLVRERLNLQERWIALRDTVLRYPTAKLVGYESYGLQADIEHFESRQKAEGVRFRIEPLGGKMAKVERIRRLVPSFSSEKFYLPFVIMQKEINLIQVFVTQELLTFPFAKHDDMLDAISRIFDPTMNARPPVRLPVDQYDRRPRPRRQGSAWAA